MVSWYGCCVVLPVKGVLCNSVGGVYSVKAGFNRLVIGVCAVSEYFVVGVGMSPCIVESPIGGIYL